MTEESIPVRISTYLLLIRNKKHENISLSLNNDLKQLFVLKWPFWPSRRGGGCIPFNYILEMMHWMVNVWYFLSHIRNLNFLFI